MRLRRPVLVILGAALALAIAVSALWLVRARLVGQFAEYYFRQHGVHAAIDMRSFGFWSASARFALGPQAAPDVAAEEIQLIFDPLRWTPYLTEVRLIHPVVRARIDPNGKVTLGSLQGWIDSLASQTGQSRYVSGDLAVSLTGLRALLATPAGVLEVEGDLKLRQNKPVSAHLEAQPGNILWRGITVAMRGARLTYDGSNLSLTFSGDAAAVGFAARKIDARATIEKLRWSDQGTSAALVHLQAHADALHAGVAFDRPGIDITALNPTMSGIDVAADVSLAASADPRFDIKAVGIRDERMRRALMRDIAHLRLVGAAHLEKHGNAISVRTTGPLALEGEDGLALQVPSLSVSQSPRGLEAAFDAALKGGRMPAAHVAATGLKWTGSQLSGDITLDARFNYLMLHDAVLSARGKISWQEGRYAFVPASCALLSLNAFHPGQSDLARNIRGAFCSSGQPLFSGEGAQWRLSGTARDVRALLPMANAQLSEAEVRADFAGNGGDFGGKMAVLTARLSDQAPQLRFNPVLGSGSMALADGKWQGRLTATDGKKTTLGTVSFRHDMATGSGSAHIDAPQLIFAQKGLQPVALSPLLAQFRQADGTVRFQGDVGWTARTMTSSGTLSVGNLDFLTPLGRAHGLKTTLVFTSLVPFKTQDNQHATISRIDWTLPFSGIDLRFSFDPQTARVAALSANWAEGHVALDPFTIDLAAPSHLSGTARLSSVALASLITASNLDSKIKLTGKVSGTIPFAANAQDIRITNGRVTADGPGQLSVSRSLWVQEGAVVSANAVQDFAYQALENLAFDQLTANLNSVANGRLQIVFHIKGRSDPPKPQIAEVAITDILSGTALQKPIPLPSGTPIDLTLDTSLNFDELLKSYAEAWSKSLSPQSDSSPGAKP
jgi:hypothetical protein